MRKNILEHGVTMFYTKIIIIVTDNAKQVFVYFMVNKNSHVE